MAKKSAERRWVSRLAFFVSREAEPTVTVPVAVPSGRTSPSPESVVKCPFTVTRPHIVLCRMVTVEPA